MLWKAKIERDIEDSRWIIFGTHNLNYERQTGNYGFWMILAANLK